MFNLLKLLPMKIKIVLAIMVLFTMICAVAEIVPKTSAAEDTGEGKNPYSYQVPPQEEQANDFVRYMDEKVKEKLPSTLKEQRNPIKAFWFWRWFIDRSEKEIDRFTDFVDNDLKIQ